MSASPEIAAVNAPADADLLLEPSLQIQDIERELQRLKQVFEANGPTAIDVGALVAVDTAGVQLLLAVKREGERRGIPVEFRGRSPALAQALKVLGLDTALFERKIA